MTENKQWPTRAQFDALKSQVDNLGAGGSTGGGAVNSVAGKTGDVTLTAADVGLGDIPARVTALEGRAQLDVEAVQDILGQMLGEAQGHYDDAAGTYTVNLPAGGALDPEQVQDIVGALIRAGSNATVTYDDAANALTISAAGGGGTTHLSVKPPYMQADNTNDQQYFGKTASGNITTTLKATRSNSVGYIAYRVTPTAAGQAQLTVRRSGVQVAQTPNVGPDGSGWMHFEFAAFIVAADDVLNLTVEFFTSESLNGRRNPDFIPSSVGEFGITSMTYANAGQDSRRGLGIRVGGSRTSSAQKGVVGPLDPVDFPISTTADAPNKSGFMVVDDTAKTASLYWKFSDGTTKKLNLT